jgi:hypothetical protein
MVRVKMGSHTPAINCAQHAICPLFGLQGRIQRESDVAQLVAHKLEDATPERPAEEEHFL